MFFILFSLTWKWKFRIKFTFRENEKGNEKKLNKKTPGVSEMYLFINIKGEQTFYFSFFFFLNFGKLEMKILKEKLNWIIQKFVTRFLYVMRKKIR